MENNCFLLTDVEKFEKVSRPMPEIKDNEVLVANKYVGICGSDLWFFTDAGNWIKDGKLEMPYMLGHECAGVVEAVGKNVKNLKVGDRVAVEPGIPCGKCEYCLSGRYNLCPDVYFLASGNPGDGGALCQYMAWPEHMTHKLPDNVSLLEGAMIEPFSIGVHATNRSKIGLGDTVVILGAGCIGLMTLLACKARGCGKAVVVDVFDNRLEKAKELGADVVVNSSNCNAVEECQKLLNGGPKFVFECAGNPITAKQSFDIVRAGGTVVIIGSTSKETGVNFSHMKDKEIEVVTSFRYANIYPTAIQAVADGRANIKDVVTDIFDFDDSEHAFYEAAHNKQAITKAAIKF